MDASFWYERWERKEIAFHEDEVNDFLVTHFASLNVMPGARVFIPLCGKTRDIAWLMSQGYQVVGAELSELAVQELFEELEVEPEIITLENHALYRAAGIDIFVGDVFALTPDMVGEVNAIYDRAALVALPLETRKRYTQLLMTLTSCAPQLVICYQYDQSKLDGPPFSISQEELFQHYQAQFEISQQDFKAVEGCLKGQVEAVESVWLLQPTSC